MKRSSRLFQVAAAGVLLAAVAGPVPAPADTPSFLRGDSNSSGVVDISDGIFTLGWLFNGSEQPTCLDSADADDSGGIDITDPIFLLQHLFVGGPAPPSPGILACGPDATEDEIGCEAFAPCETGPERTEALMILVEHDSIDGLVNMAYECYQRGIRPAVLAKAFFVEENARIFRALHYHGVEVIGWCGPTLWGMPYEEQRELVAATKASIEASIEAPLAAIGTRLFGTDRTTCSVAEELGIPCVVARGTTGTRASVYQPAGMAVKVISVSNIDSGAWALGSLSDRGIWARGGTPEDLRTEVRAALSHDRITPVCHPRLGGLKKAWNDVFRAELLDNARVDFRSLAEFTGVVDVTLPLESIPENRGDPYGPMDPDARIPVNLQVTEYQDPAALEQVMDEIARRGIGTTTIFAGEDLGDTSCELLRRYDAEGHELAAYGWGETEQGTRIRVGELPRAEQEALISQAKQKIEDCLGHSMDGFRTMYFSQNQDTNDIVANLGFRWHGSFVGGGSSLPGHEAAVSPYRSAEHAFTVISMIGVANPSGGASPLCDTGLRNRVENAAEWGALVKSFFEDSREKGVPFLTEFHPYFLVGDPSWWDAFVDLVSWLGQEDARFVTTSELIALWENQYAPAPSPAVPYATEPDVEVRHTIEDFPHIPGSGDVGRRIVVYHNGAGPMCLEFLDFIDTIDYPVEQHLVGEPDFWSGLGALEAEYGESEGVSTTFGFYPIIFIRTRAFSGFNAWVEAELSTIIAE